MHAFLIVGGTKETRGQRIQDKLGEWHVGTFDRIDLATEGESIGIADVREFQRRFMLAPHQSPISAGIIHEADLLTPQAQQALLKTLEEPPPHAKIILETTHTESLLPTVISRCTVIDLGHASQYSQKDILSCIGVIRNFTRTGVADRLKIVDPLAANRDIANQWVDLAITAAREVLLATYKGEKTPFTTDNVDAVSLVRSLLIAKSQLAANVNPKLVLDAFALSFP